jgi:hypothetical protein
MIDTRTVAAPIETVTPIKPSEAIRLGCLTTVQKFDGFGFDDETEACAEGAMLVGYGESRASDGLGERIRAHFPTMDYYFQPCPACANEPMEHRYVSPIYRLNDDHRWARERIADWLESLGL